MIKQQSMKRRHMYMDFDIIAEDSRYVCGGDRRLSQGGTLSSWMKRAQRRRERFALNKAVQV